MSNNGAAPIPQGAVHFAQRIVDRFRLEKASAIGFIEQTIRDAIEEARYVEREREMIGCHACGTIQARYQTIREEFGHSCPACRGPMRALDVLDRMKIVELEEKLKSLEPRN